MKKSKLIKLLNTTLGVHLSAFGVDLSTDEEAAIDRLQTKLQEDNELQKLFTSTDALEKMKFKFDELVDDLLLNLISTKIDLYIKLTKPEINMFFKSKWFETFLRQAPAT